MITKAIKELIAKSSNKPLILFGPSGSGKSTLANHILTKYRNHFDLSVSCTTRPLRAGEVHGKNYYFISNKEFNTRLDAGEFLEYMEYNKNYYGTQISELSRIIENKKVPVLDIDYNGVQRMIELFGEENSMRIFVNVTDQSILKERLRSRKTETEESLNSRLAITLQELAYLSQHKLYTHTVNNDDLETAKNDVESLALSQYSKLEISKILN